MSGLAEGADMVFAEAALGLGIEVVPVLPAQPDVFAEDFERPAHPDRDPAELRIRFHKLLEQCAEPVIVAENVEKDDPTRYARVGSFLLRHCQILFALWDGIPSDKVGGTAHVVEMTRTGKYDYSWEAHRHGQDEPLRILNAPEPIEIHQLLVSRKTPAPPGILSWSGKQEELPVYQPNQALAALERFNEDSAKFIAKCPNVVEGFCAQLCLDSAVLSGPERNILGVFSVADALAISFQRRSSSTLGLISWIALFIVVAFEYYSNIQGHWLFVMLYLGGLLFGYGAYRLDKERRTYARFVDYRGLAEGLRVLLFWRLSGLPNSAADHYLRKQRTEISWIRQAMYTLNIGPRRTSPRLDLVKKCWIENQVDYFERSSPRDKKTHDRLIRSAESIFITGLVLAGALLAIECAAGDRLHDWYWMHWLILLTGLLPASAAILSGYADRKGLAQHAKRYAQMLEIFKLAADEFKTIDEPSHLDRLKRTVFELGEEALSENGDWILLHRERSIAPPNR